MQGVGSRVLAEGIKEQQKNGGVGREDEEEVEEISN